MASTIKLKNSTTAGNAPSSLEQGEVAINVADGNLFYGDGSSVLQNFALNNITASDNISASGHITASDMFLSGDLTLGKTDDSVLTIVSDGSNISHEIHGRENSHSFLSTPTTQNLGIGLNTNETPQAKLHVSGNISASGDLIVNNINGIINGGTF